ncbi:MAG: VOC family protein [Pseudomonadota bacterium]
MGLDHIVVGAASLERGLVWAERTFGVSLAQGGKHPGRGTCNALGGLGSNTYLELLAYDPEQERPPADFLPEDEPELIHYAVGTNNLATVRASAIERGLRPGEITPWKRETADGTVLHWELLFIYGHDAGAAMPFFIDWHATPKPGDTLTQVATLDSIHIETPHVELIQPILESAQCALKVERSPVTKLHCDIISLGACSTANPDLMTSTPHPQKITISSGDGFPRGMMPDPI